MTKLVSPPPDTVSEVLRSYGVRSTIFCLSELRTPWAFRVEGEPVAKFHLILEGSALLFSDAGSVTLAAGDLAVLPHGSAHTLADDRDSRAAAAPLERLLADHAVDGGSRFRYGGAGPLTRLLCGGFALAEGIPDPTPALLPDLLHIAYDPAVTPWLEPTLLALKAEAENGRPGAGAIVAKIADVFLAQALRAWLLQGEPDGLADARLILDEPIARAVRALNSRPAEAWSLDRLGRHVGLSRTALADKFRKRVGQPPMQYLTEVRLRSAAGYLETGRLSLHQVARRSGYDSDAAFAKAFKRRFGVTPGAYRESAGRPPRIEIAALP
jgi:AraC family transcriptional activator of mtrCDE